MSEASTSRGVQRLRALADLARQLASPIELPTLLESALVHAAELTGADAGCLRLLENSGELRIAAHWNVHPRHVERYSKVQWSDKAAPLAAAIGGPVILPVEALGEELGGLLGPRGGRAAVAALGQNRAGPGFLILAFRRKRSLPEEDLETLRTIAALLGTAVANERAHERLKREAQTDPLTGLSSRRHFEDHFRRELARSRRGGRPLSLAMIDVDHLKKINDTYGHVMGDRALEAMGRLLLEVRASDVVARYGGDEFIVLMPDTTLDEAEAVADRIRQRLDRFNEERELQFPLSASIGVRQMTNVDTDIVAEADAAMYRDKRSRREAGDPLRQSVEKELVAARTGSDR